MTLLRRMKLGFGALLIVVAILMGLNFAELFWIHSTQTWIGEQEERVRNANQMMSSVNAMNEDITFVNDATARGAGVAQVHDSFVADAAEAATLMDTALESVKAGSEDAAALENISGLLDQYQQALSTLQAGKLLEVTLLGTQLSEAAAPYAEKMMALLDAKRARLGDMATVCLILTGVLGIIAVVGGILFSWLLSRRIGRNLHEAATGISTSAAELMAVASQVAAGTAQTAASTNETTVTVEEVKQTAILAHEKASQAAQGAQGAVGMAGSARTLTEETASGIERMQSEMDVVFETINRLSEQTQAAGDVIAMVNDLAEQSNLLSVNASIEAAKAGEYGKGFTVVAQEVKSLAEQSKQAVAQVRTMLSEIQKASQMAVQAAAHSREAVEAGRQQSVEAGEVIQRLADGAGEDAQASLQVVASSQQQLAGMEQIAQAISSINEAGNQSVAGTRQVEQEVKRLQDLALQLKCLVEADAEE
jgi:methyl-accepting chemotaxis protein